MIQTVLTVTMTPEDAAAIVPDWHRAGGHDRLVAEYAETMNIGGDTGAWYWKVTRTGEKAAEGQPDKRDIKLVGRYIPAGEHVVG